MGNGRTTRSCTRGAISKEVAGGHYLAMGVFPHGRFNGSVTEPHGLVEFSTLIFGQPITVESYLTNN